MKECSKCFILKHDEEFYKDRNKPQGLDSQCKLCKYGKKEEKPLKKNKFKVFWD